MVPSLSSALLCALALLLVSVGIEDARTREIANWKNAAVAVLAPAWWWAAGIAPWPDVVIQIGVAAATLLTFALFFRFGWMGGGDVKLIAALALWLPAGPLASMLVLMSLVGGGLTAVMVADQILARRKGPVEVPYGVAIALAALITIHEPILNQFP
jgi:prepilin peptidase CpaA